MASGRSARVSGRLARFSGLCDRLASSRAFVGLLMLPNLAGIVFGYYYYVEAGQFDPESRFFRDLPWWPFIPDSPNAVLVMSVALAGWAFFGWRSRILDAIAFTSMVYVGVWTTFLFLGYQDAMGTFDWASVPDGQANPVLFVSHMGMPLEALLIAPRMARDLGPVPHLQGSRLPGTWVVVGAAAGWSALNVALDYFGPHLHPAPFLHDRLACAGAIPPGTSPCDTALHAVSPWLMAGTLALYVALARPWRRHRA